MNKQLLILLLLCLTIVQNTFAAESVTVDLIIKNHKFEPEILELPAGKKIRLVIHNQDSTIEEFESFDLKREKIVLPKSKTVIVLAPLKPGEYKFFGEFHEDTAQGKIIVKEQHKAEEKIND